MSEPALIHGAMTQVAESIGAIGKSQSNDFHGYNFRGVDDVLNHFHGPLTAAGVTVVPRVLKVESDWWPGDKPRRLIRVEMEFAFTADDGSSVSAITVGEAADTDDKAANKAMAAAFKYAMLLTFCVPTGDVDEQDKTSPISQGQQPTAQPQRTHQTAIPTDVGPPCTNCDKPTVPNPKWEDGSKRPTHHCQSGCKDKSGKYPLGVWAKTETRPPDDVPVPDDADVPF